MTQHNIDIFQFKILLSRESFAAESFFYQVFRVKVKGNSWHFLWPEKYDKHLGGWGPWVSAALD